jgi:hypothetical protein
VSAAQAAVNAVAMTTGEPTGFWGSRAALAPVDSSLRTFEQLGTVAHAAASALAMVAFLRWLALLVRAARGLGAEVSYSPSNAVLSFFVPIANFVLPARVLRTLASALAPERLPEPPVRVIADGSAGYRDARLVAPPAAASVPAALINVWWLTYFIAPFCIAALLLVLTVCIDPRHPVQSYASLQGSMALGGFVRLIAAFCAMRMVRVLTLLLEERLRRIRHNPEEVLRRVGLVLE